MAKTAPPFDYPTWAKWVAQDANGAWWAYQVKPLEFHQGWYENEVGLYIKVSESTPPEDWRTMLIKL